MAEFTAIETQEALDSIIKERLDRQKKTHAEEIKTLNDNINALQKQRDDLLEEKRTNSEKYSGYEKTISEANAKIKAYETASVKTRIAFEKGIPYELTDMLKGETEEELIKSADVLSKYMSNKNIVSPLAETETPGNGDGRRSALKALANNLTNKGE